MLLKTINRNILFSLLKFHVKTIKFNFCLRNINTRTVLGIETSCDETGIAIVDENGNLISDVCHSQLQIHLDYGGIIPPVARNLHKFNIDSCVKRTFEKTQMKPDQISAIAVTVKPGLSLSLLIGKNYAQTLALKYSKPFIPIHHMEAHALTVMMENPQVKFPFLTLLISGGHCIIAVVKGIDDFLLLGQSVDDAPGDILDKISRRLKLRNLGEPFNRISGGQAIELLAKSGNELAYFTNPQLFPLKQRTCNFSFAEFNGKVLRLIETLEQEFNLEPDAVLPQAADIAASVQRFITAYLIKRLKRAFIFVDWNHLLDGQSFHLVISGGCACNSYITNAIKNYCLTEGINVYVPRKNLCTDNGIMIAWNGVLKLRSENEFPNLIKRTKHEIEQVDIESECLLGKDLSMQVNMQRIPVHKIDFDKVFIKN